MSDKGKIITFDQFEEQDPVLAEDLSVGLIEGDILMLEQCKDIKYQLIREALKRWSRIYLYDFRKYCRLKKVAEDLYDNCHASGLNFVSTRIPSFQIEVEDIEKLSEIFIKEGVEAYYEVATVFLSWGKDKKLFNLFYDFFKNANKVNRCRLIELEGFISADYDLMFIAINLIENEDSGVAEYVFSHLKELRIHGLLDENLRKEIVENLNSGISVKILDLELQVKLQLKKNLVGKVLN